MKPITLRRALALLMSLCLLTLPLLAAADTYLPQGDVTHVDFTLGAAVHADGFPASKAHLADWEAFLQKLDIKGSMDVLAALTPESRVYLDGALRLNGKTQIPFVYDGYHSYRYFITPALGNEVFHFQMHNFLEFMLKPYYYMELPTQYLALLLYPQASYSLGDHYYTPVAEMMAAARQDAIETAAQEREQAVAAVTTAYADAGATLNALTVGKAELETALAAGDTAALAVLLAKYADGAAKAGVDATADARELITALDGRIAQATTAKAALEAVLAQQESLTLEQLLAAANESGIALPATNADVVASANADMLTYTVPYQHLYELCENLNLIVNDDPELERAYFYFTSLLTELYASDMVLDILGRLEDVLDYLDPEQAGMLVTETATGFTCILGTTEVFTKSVEEGATYVRLSLPTPEGFEFALDYLWDSAGNGAALKASAAIIMEGKTSIMLTAEGDGLPRQGDVGGQGQITFTAGGTSLQSETVPVTFQFDWARDSVTLPYTLGFTLSWVHPQTGKPAVSVDFIGMFAASDKSVFVDAAYPQNDFFNLNESFLNDYKERLLKPLLLKLAPIILETPAGVVNDLYAFTTKHDILVSLVE